MTIDKKYTVVVILSLILTFIIGINVGAKIGVNQWISRAAPYRGAENVKLLQLLNAQEIQQVREYLELELDSQIVIHWDSLNSRDWPLITGESDSLNNMQDSFITDIIEYRKTNPSIGRNIIQRSKDKEAAESFISNLEKAQSDVEIKTKLLLDYYDNIYKNSQEE
ncbi:MAG: hypothetical protein JAY97_13735 [Candidatus Thiodiazotropha sp. 'RUGA']|nr:hypothetical protein [Candidatus Thiodiazotropha sp. 'RUGA']